MDFTFVPVDVQERTTVFLHAGTRLREYLTFPFSFFGHHFPVTRAQVELS